jgi:predicted glycoside hydrolase/deacetylase ChbG (UPF0249 family)
MHSISFSADDFGKSDLANKNILNLVRQGKIQRVSVMVNRKISKEEISKLLKSKVRQDIHLELPQGNKEYTGAFIRSFLFIGRLIIGKNSAKQVANSWEHQVEKFISIFNQPPSGLNSHEHVHFFPPYFKIALRLCEKYKIEYIRFGEKGVILNGNSVSWILKILNQLNKKYFLSHKLRIKSCDYLISLDWLKNLDSLLKPENDYKNSIELVCHPEREEEYKILSKTVIR